MIKIVNNYERTSVKDLIQKIANELRKNKKTHIDK